MEIDISHELKTLLTIMRGEIELTLRRIRTRKEYIRTLENLLEEVEELHGFIEDLLKRFPD